MSLPYSFYLGECEIPPLRKGEVRVMFESDKGHPIVMDFEPGKVNTELRERVHGFLKFKIVD